MSLDAEDKQWVQERIDHSVSEVVSEVRGLLRDMETRLLTAFHDWASPQVLRVDSHSAALRALDAGYEDLRKRVERLENPPSA